MKYIIDTEKGTCFPYEEQEAYQTFSQNDIRWKKKKLGNSNLTIGNYGCYVTALANLTNEFTPLEVNNILKANNLFSGALIKREFNKVAEVLGLEFFGYNKDGYFKPEYNTIKEVRMGKSQHFVLRIYNNNKPFIIDSWDGKKKDNYTYSFISYRLFKK